MFGKFKKLFKGKITETLEAAHQPKAREHHYIFVHDAFRSLMFDNDGLAKRLGSPGGRQITLSLWEKVGQRLEERGLGDALSSEGLEVTFQGFMILVQLPEPIGVKEAYYIGILDLPLAQPWEAFLRYFTLEVGSTFGSTVIGEWEDDTYRELGVGPPPSKEAFVEAIKKIYIAS